MHPPVRLHHILCWSPPPPPSPESEAGAAWIADYRVNVVPELEEAIIHQDDCLIMEQANLNNIRTIGHVLAQTVALHFYETCAPPPANLQQVGAG